MPGITCYTNMAVHSEADKQMYTTLICN